MIRPALDQPAGQNAESEVGISAALHEALVPLRTWYSRPGLVRLGVRPSPDAFRDGGTIEVFEAQT